jgi:hypothetical protein
MASFGLPVILANRTVTATTAGTAHVITSDNVIVSGITAAVTGGTSRQVTFQDSDETVIMILQVPANGTVVVPIPFIADNGLEVFTSGTTVNVTVFHSHPGR